MNETVAVMDLGTNTFHLLIAKGTAPDFMELEHEQDAVKLGEGGINKGLIQPAAFERGVQAMLRYHQLIQKHKVKQVKAIATSALRSAANGQEFITEVKVKTGITIQLIDGDQEAAYIYKGVMAGGILSAENSLIVDIGGGSVECIICNNKEIKWKQSFEIGAARLMDQFHGTDPVTQQSINDLKAYLEESLAELFAAAKDHPIFNLIGSSGVFESYASLAEHEKGNAHDLKKQKEYTFDKAALLLILDELIRSTHRQRAANKAIIPIRVDMIVTASLLTEFIINRLDIGIIAMSTNSLKEGVLADMLGPSD